MGDKEFFDELFQLWTKTTWAENSFWMSEKIGPNLGFTIHAIRQDERKRTVAMRLSESDADFITALHGCFGDLYRRLVDALDEADRADYDRDSRECRIAELEMENSGFQDELSEMREQISDLEAENDRWQEMAEDLDWKIQMLEDRLSG